MFTFESDCPAKLIDNDGSTRQILAHSDELMVCKLHGKAGSGVLEHKHSHTQVTYVISGRVRVTIGGETRELQAGDSALMPPNIAHSALNLEDTVSLDIFTPERKDFLGI